MAQRSPLLFLSCVSAIGIIGWIHARRPPAIPGEVETLPPLPATPGAPPGIVADFRPPQPSEVCAALERAFPGAIPPDAVRPDWAVAGDFNGDDSPDLVAPARPIEERLAIINADTANWILQDPSSPSLGPGTDPPPAPVVGKGDMLLAVVHGLGPSGWRDPQARQAYLLAVSLEGRITVQKREALLARATRSERRLPRLRGDFLYEDAGARFLYWTGARYVWHAAP
jgi:hypothetical protein